MELPAISLQGLDRAQRSFERSAERLASLDADSPIPSDSVDLSTTAVDLLTARDNFSVNLKVLQIADQMERRTLDLLG